MTELTNEELATIALAGDQAAKDYLFERNNRFIHYIAKKFESTGIDKNDLLGLAGIGMVKAFNSFKPDKDIKFITYATRCMENEILMYLRKHTKHVKNTSQFDKPINVDEDGNEQTLMDVLVSPESGHIAEREDRQSLLNMLADFMEHEPNELLRKLIQLRVIEGRRQAEIHKLLGISQSYVSRVEKKAIEKLRMYAKKHNVLDRGYDPTKKGAGSVMAKQSFYDVPKLIYMLKNHPELSYPDISKILTIPEASVGYYGTRVKQGRIHTKADAGAAPLVEAYLAGLSGEEKAKVERRKQRLNKNEHEKSSEVKVYHIDPVPKTAPALMPAPTLAKPAEPVKDKPMFPQQPEPAPVVPKVTEVKAPEQKPVEPAFTEVMQQPEQTVHAFSHAGTQPTSRRMTQLALEGADGLEVMRIITMLLQGVEHGKNYTIGLFVQEEEIEAIR